VPCWLSDPRHALAERRHVLVRTNQHGSICLLGAIRKLTSHGFVLLYGERGEWWDAATRVKPGGCCNGV
jgi:hypothetical protein